MKVIYIAGPFTSNNAWEIEQNIRRAEEMGFRVAALGAMPLIPHANTRHFHGTLTLEFWYQGTAELLKRCDAVLFLDDWQQSKGARDEARLAEVFGIPRFFKISDLAVWLSPVLNSLIGGTGLISLDAPDTEPEDLWIPDLGGEA